MTLSLIVAIREFTAEQLAKVENDAPNAASHVRAVILSGEALSSMQKMQKLLVKALPEFEDRFLFSISSNLVGAAGAAHRARQTVTDPFFTDPRKPEDHEHYSQEQVNGHSELKEL